MNSNYYVNITHTGKSRTVNFSKAKQWTILLYTEFLLIALDLKHLNQYSVLFCF